MKRALLVALCLLAGCKQLFGLDEPTNAADAMSDAAMDAGPPLSEWSDVATGFLHTCGRKLDGSLWCWGDNQFWQLGGPGALQTSTPQRIGSTSDVWAALSSNTHTTCGIKSDQTLWCWGYNAHGQVGTGTISATTMPAQVAGTWVQISAGIESTCGITTSGGLSCWGLNMYGELGDGTTADRSTPSALSPGWSSVTVGDYHACGIRGDGTLWCWGLNSSQQLGDTAANTSTPRMVDGGPWIAVAAGAVSTCAIDVAHRVRCWGDNTLGELGRGTTGGLGGVAPVLSAGADRTDWSAITGRGYTFCGRHTDNTVDCWGDNMQGQLAIEGGDRNSPSPIPGTWSTVATGTHTCLLDDAHHLQCAGTAASGELGDAVRHQRAPVQLPVTARYINAGYSSTCILDTNGVASCTGYGYLGDGSATRARQTFGVVESAAYASIDSGVAARCGITTTGDLRCWGQNAWGNVGNNTTVLVLSPVTIGPNATVARAGTHSCAISASGQLGCWGLDDFGEVGNGTIAGSVPAPATVGASTVWTEVAVGYYHTCGRAGTAVSCWGFNGTGQLGDGSMNNASSPVGISGAFSQIAAGDNHTCGLDDAGRLLCWGYNAYGQLGVGDTNTRNTPTVVMPTATWKQVDLGGTHSCAIRSDNSLWCWGHNAFGQLGIPAAQADLTAPSQVGMDSDWKSVTVADGHTCAMKLDDSVWCWGDNFLGQLGDGLAWRTELRPVP